jgi:hypothetical protein
VFACSPLSSLALPSLFTWLGLAGLVAHWAAFARLTYWELSWDVMEPAAFLVSQLWVVIAYVYFMFTRMECVHSTPPGLINAAY